MKKLLVILISFMAVGNGFGQIPPVNLKCEYLANPMGIDIQKPRFSWLFKGIPNAKGEAQQSYQILVSSSKAKIAFDEGDMWSSGREGSNKTTWIEYKGTPLEAKKRYYWKVRTYNQSGVFSPWSEDAWFEMGMLKKTDWQAQWIGVAGTEGKPPKAVELNKEFTSPKPIKQARVYITGLGAYQLKINGKKVGQDLLTPGWTHYLKTIHYQTYDITPYLKQGQNEARVDLGNVWWSSGLGWQSGFRYSDGPNRLLCQFEIEYTDGTKDIINSDESWKGRLSAITENSLYHGESYDARLEGKGDWKPVVILTNTKDKTTMYNTDKIAIAEGDEYFSTALATLKASNSSMIQEQEDIQALSVKQVKPNVYVYDFGQNMVGFTQLKITGKEGTILTLKYAELLHPDGTVAQENLRKAKATDQYILKGGAEEQWQPMFTYHGFRYVEVSGGKPKLTAKVIHNQAKVTGKFACSEELINKIYKNVTWGQRGNMHSVPTDCPQRDERLGWMGDAQIFAPTASYSMDMSGFFAKWTKDITDSQHSTGYVYDVNPKIVVDGPSKPGWGDAILAVPFAMYRFYGDTRILAENYEGMKAWVEYMNNHKSTKETGLYFFGEGGWHGYGDWVPVDKSPTKPIGGAYQAYSNKLLGEIAAILEKETDAKNYTALSKKYAEKFQEIYFNKTTNQYEGATQSANLLPLNMGITPPDLQKTVAQNITDNVIAKGNHLSTGFLGTGYLLPTLSNNGQHELAYKVATQRSYPSWGYMIDQGATTMWELWNSDKERPDQMNSRNHFAYGSVGEWFYSHLLGIMPNAPGFKSVIIAPKPAGNLTWVEGSYESVNGLIEVRWDNKGGKFTLKITVPANTTAKVILPSMNKVNPLVHEGINPLFKNGKKFSNAQGVTFVELQNNNETVWNVTSGKYEFSVE